MRLILIAGFCFLATLVRAQDGQSSGDPASESARYVVVESETWQGEGVQDTLKACRAMFDGLGVPYRTVTNGLFGSVQIADARIVFVANGQRLSKATEAHLESVHERGAGVLSCKRWWFLNFGEFERRLGKEFPAEREYWAEVRRRNLDRRSRELRRISLMQSKADEVHSVSFHNYRWLPVLDGKTVSWDEAVRILRERGFTRMTSGNCAPNLVRYKSRVLPVSTGVSEKGDELDAFIAACRRHGVMSEVCLRCFKNQLTDEPTPEFDRWIEREGRGCVSKDGKKDKEWLCPNHPLNRKLVVDACIELAQKGADAISLDYIRYPNADGCWCERCRKAIAEAGGDPVRHRKDVITSTVREVRSRMKKDAPRTRLVASVLIDPGGFAGKVGQAWDEWCEDGLLDEVEPMDYVDDPKEFERLVRRQKTLAHGVRLTPFLGPSLWPDDFHAEWRAAEMIGICRSLGCEGFAWFTCDDRTNRILVALRKILCCPQVNAEYSR